MRMKKITNKETKVNEPTIDSLTLTKKIKSFTKYLKDINLSNYSNLEKKNLKEQLDYLTSTIYDLEA